MEALTEQTRFPETPMEVHNARADTADAPAATPNLTEPIALGPATASSSKQVIL